MRRLMLFKEKGTTMKKLLLTLLSWSIILAAEVGPQPLFISNITITPNSPIAADGVNLTITGSGGQPTADGSYTYDLQIDGFNPETTQVAQFNNVLISQLAHGINLVITDTANNTVTYVLTNNSAPFIPLIFSIDSLPLGNGSGCITLSAVNPSFPINFAVGFEEDVVEITKSKAPFSQTFSAFPNIVPGLFARINQSNVTFTIQFPFPQGMSNALKAYIFNKYCNCALSSTTVPAATAT